MKTRQTTNHIAHWLKDYCLSSHKKGFVIGISGGIDSAVTSTLAAQTKLNVFVVSLPIHQYQSEFDRAEAHSNELVSNFSNVKKFNFNLTDVFELFSQKINTSSQNANNDLLSKANLRARIRMSMLYYLAGLNNLLVCGTGNKIEDFGIGFFTKYGDGGVDINPIANLYKSEVYEIGKYLNINKNILTAPPTDGLWEDNTKTDEQQIGASYKELEWAMQLHESNNKIDTINFSKRQHFVFNLYKRLNQANKHKMNPIPTCTIPLNLRE